MISHYTNMQGLSGPACPLLHLLIGITVSGWWVDTHPQTSCWLHINTTVYQFICPKVTPAVRARVQMCVRGLSGQVTWISHHGTLIPRKQRGEAAVGPSAQIISTLVTQRRLQSSDLLPNTLLRSPVVEVDVLFSEFTVCSQSFKTVKTTLMTFKG